MDAGGGVAGGCADAEALSAATADGVASAWTAAAGALEEAEGAPAFEPNASTVPTSPAFPAVCGAFDFIK
jgi:hypothetical protein